MVSPAPGSMDSSFNHLNDVVLSELNNGIEPADDITQGLSSNSSNAGTTMPTFEVSTFALLMFSFFFFLFPWYM